MKSMIRLHIFLFVVLAVWPHESVGRRAHSSKDRLGRSRKKTLAQYFSFGASIDGADTEVEADAPSDIDSGGDVDQVVNRKVDESVEPDVETDSGTEETEQERVETQGAQQNVQETKKPSTSSGLIDKAVLAKRESVMKLVDKGIDFLKDNSLYDACYAFTHDKSFKKGELYLFLFDKHGTCFAHGDQSRLVWQDLHDMRDDYGSFVVQDIIKSAHDGSGWVTYRWRNATKTSFVKEIQKDGKTYVIGTGYYPHSKEDAVVSLVKGAVSLFNEVVQGGRSKDEAFSSFNYPLGRFIFGDLYLYAVDFDGLQLAHGELPGIIGTNVLNYKDSRGLLVNQEIIKQLQEAGTDGGVWVEYMSKKASKRAYAQMVTDLAGKKYFIASGFYPDSDRSQVVKLVRRGYTYMKRNGRSQSATAFSKKLENDFRYGDLFLFVYGLKGKNKGIVVAHGGNQTFMGQNHLNYKDDDGNYYVQDMIAKAESGGGWIDYKSNNTFQTVYVEKIDLGIDEFVIGSGMYPVSKRDTMELLAKSGAGYLKSNDLKVACREMIQADGRFVRGDLSLFMFDSEGLCYAYGDNHDLIWQNFMKALDENGKEYVRMFVSVARSGADRVSYAMNGSMRTAYIVPVQKDGKLYIIGSEYYQ